MGFLSFFKFTKIQNKLFISYALIIVISLGLSVTAVYKTSDWIIKKQVGVSRLEAMRQVSLNINYLLNEIRAVSNLYYFDENLQDIFITPMPENAYEKRVEENIISEKISQYKYSFEVRNIYYDVMIYTFSGKAITSRIYDWYEYDLKALLEQSWLHQLMNSDGDIIWISTFDNNATTQLKENENIFTAARIIKHHYSNEPIAILLLNVHEESLLNIYSNAFDSDNNIYIIDQKGKIISHKDGSLIGKKPLFSEPKLSKMLTEESNSMTVDSANGSVLVTYYKIPQSQWTIVEEVAMESLLKQLNSLSLITLVILLLCLMVAFGVSYYFTRFISYPIKNLFILMKKIKSGNLNVLAKVETNDEIGELSRGFNSMVVTIQELMEKIRVEEKLKHQVEMDFLIAQINPHFLYNTLNSIRVIISLGEKETAEEMLISFMKLLRKIFKENEFVLISQEIEIVECYVHIMKYRYEGKFDVIYDISEEIKECLTLKLILQPIVENAIFHGVEPMDGQGMILIRAWKEDDQLIFQIIDDGIGMLNEQVEAILKEDHSEYHRRFNKIGIKNVHDRLVLHFGYQYGVRITSEDGNGTTVEVRMPFTKRKPGEIESA